MFPPPENSQSPRGEPGPPPPDTVKPLGTINHIRFMIVDPWLTTVRKSVQSGGTLPAATVSGNTSRVYAVTWPSGETAVSVSIGPPALADPSNLYVSPGLPETVYTHWKVPDAPAGRLAIEAGVGPDFHVFTAVPRGAKYQGTTFPREVVPLLTTSMETSTSYPEPILTGSMDRLAEKSPIVTVFEVDSWEETVPFSAWFANVTVPAEAAS